MDYRAAYDRQLEQLMHDLSEVETVEAAHNFGVRAAQRLKVEATTTQEFYVGEFLNMLRHAVGRQAEAEMASCEQAISDAQLEASLAKVELQARLEAARAANDREAEHAVWGEREKRQAACQAKVDAAMSRIGVISTRLTACQDLASALGFGTT